MSDWELTVRVEPKILWREPPKDMAEAALRQRAELRVQALANLVAKEVELMLLDKIEGITVSGDANP